MGKASHASTSPSPKKSRKARKTNLENEDPISGEASYGIYSDGHFSSFQKSSDSANVQSVARESAKVPVVTIKNSTAFEYGNESPENQRQSRNDSFSRQLSLSPTKFEKYAKIGQADIQNPFAPPRRAVGPESVIAAAAPTKQKASRSLALRIRKTDTYTRRARRGEKSQSNNITPLAKEDRSSFFNSLIQSKDKPCEATNSRVSECISEGLARLIEAEHQPAVMVAEAELPQEDHLDESREEDAKQKKQRRQKLERKGAKSNMRTRPSAPAEVPAPTVEKPAEYQEPAITTAPLAEEPAASSEHGESSKQATITFQEIQHRAFLLQQNEMALQCNLEAMKVPQVPRVVSTESAMSGGTQQLLQRYARMLEDDDSRGQHFQSQEVGSQECSLVDGASLSRHFAARPSAGEVESADARSCLNERQRYLMTEIDKMRTELQELRVAEQELYQMEGDEQQVQQLQSCGSQMLQSQEEHQNPLNWGEQAELSVEQFNMRLLSNLEEAQNHFEREEHEDTLALPESPPTKLVNLSQTQEEILHLQPVQEAVSNFRHEESTPSPLHPEEGYNPTMTESSPQMYFLDQQSPSNEGSFVLQPQIISNPRTAQRSPLKARRDRKLSPQKPTGDFYDAELDQPEEVGDAYTTEGMTTLRSQCDSVHSKESKRKERRNRKSRSKSKEGAAKKTRKLVAPAGPEPCAPGFLDHTMQEPRAGTEHLLHEFIYDQACSPSASCLQLQQTGSPSTMFDQKFVQTQESSIERGDRVCDHSASEFGLINIRTGEPEQTEEPLQSSPPQQSHHFHSFDEDPKEGCGLSPQSPPDQSPSNTNSLLNTQVLKQQQEPMISDDEEEVFSTARDASPSLLRAAPSSVLGGAFMPPPANASNDSTQTAEFNDVCNMESQQLAAHSSQSLMSHSRSHASELQAALEAAQIEEPGRPLYQPAEQQTFGEEPSSFLRAGRGGLTRQSSIASSHHVFGVFDYDQAESLKHARKRAIEKAEEILKQQTTVQVRSKNTVLESILGTAQNEVYCPASHFQSKSSKCSFMSTPHHRSFYEEEVLDFGNNTTRVVAPQVTSLSST